MFIRVFVRLCLCVFTCIFVFVCLCVSVEVFVIFCVSVTSVLRAGYGPTFTQRNDRADDSTRP